MRLLRSPLLHFLAGGAAVFALVRTASPPAYGARAEPLVVSAADVERLRADYQRESGLDATADDETALIDKAIDEELLLREALARGLQHDRSIRNWLIEQMRVLSDGAPAELDDEALHARALELGLDRTDVVVRRLLVQKMRLLAARLDEQPPSDAALAAFYAAHAGDYRPPGRVTFRHVFFAARAGGDPFAAASAATGRPMTAGDAFPVPPRVVGYSHAQIAKLFGADFAAAVETLEPGAWRGPVASPYGAHLVWVESREAGATPPLDAVRGRLTERWLAEQRQARTAALLDQLRRRYPLQVASAAWSDRRGQ